MISGGDIPRGEQIVEQAINMARASGDLRALLTVLGKAYYIQVGEPATGTRARLLAEAEDVSRALGSHVLQRMVEMWSVRHAFELGAPDARSRLANVIGERRPVGDDRPGFIAIWDCMTAVLDGDFATAQQLCEERMSVWDHPDLQATGLAQLFVIRREQGRIAELEPMAAAVIDSLPGLPAFDAALALARAELGRLDEAQAALDEWVAGRFSNFDYSLDKGVALFALGEVMARVPRPDGAAELYELVAPYTGTCAIAGGSGCCLGSMDRSLGQIATVLKRWDDAEAHFEAALEFETRLESPPLIARTRYWYADTLLKRGQAGDATRALALLDASEAVATELGMATLVREASALRDR
jgi:hypothetical protein